MAMKRLLTVLTLFTSLCLHGAVPSLETTTNIATAAAQANSFVSPSSKGFTNFANTMIGDPNAPSPNANWTVAIPQNNGGATSNSFFGIPNVNYGMSVVGGNLYYSGFFVDNSQVITPNAYWSGPIFQGGVNYAPFYGGLFGGLYMYGTIQDVAVAYLDYQNVGAGNPTMAFCLTATGQPSDPDTVDNIRYTNGVPGGMKIGYLGQIINEYPVMTADASFPAYPALQHVFLSYTLTSTNNGTPVFSTTNVMAEGFSADGIFKIGSMAAPTLSYNNTSSDGFGNTQHQVAQVSGAIGTMSVTIATNYVALGSGGVMVSNVLTQNTNILLNSAGFTTPTLGANTPHYWNSSLGSYTNANISWISNAGPGVFVFRKTGFPGSGAATNTSGFASGSWTNANGWETNAFTYFLPVTNQYVYVFSNSAPRVQINNPITIGTAYTNLLNVKLEGRATFFLNSSAISGFPGLVYSNFTTGVTETLTNGFALAGTDSKSFFFSVYPGEVVGFYDRSSGSASVNMQTNNLSYP